ncbi:MAG: hypothetical protein ABI220_00435 [Candidatus Saccharimonadales bacterium]
MRTALTTIKRTMLYITVLLTTALAPILTTSGNTFADGIAETPCVAPADSTYGPGIHRPTGSSANTYTYQCKGDYALMWTNTHFVFNPTSGVKTPLFNRDYQYSCDNSTWTMKDWSYSPARRIFIEVRIAATSTPNLPTNCPVAPVTNYSNPAGNDTSISNTEPGSGNTADSNVSVNADKTNTTTLGMNNSTSSLAGSGNTSVTGNTAGGNATSGNTQSLVNIANLLQSSGNAFGPGVIAFTADINGDVNGDFMFDPSALISNTGPTSSNNSSNGVTINQSEANNTSAQINNNIDVNATSGNAEVANNTTAGGATSGNATAIVNLMNIINSVISSGQSFVGTVNINGSLNGDILLPQNFIDQLLASTGPGSNNSATSTLNTNNVVTNNLVSDIKNNINSTAQSGDAKVAGNTNASTAESGSAGTNVTIFNLTGSTVIGGNNLLVFVNVLGHWVGMIVNAPAGTTAASLGGSITGTGPNSNNTTSNHLDETTTSTNNSNFGINNNVNVNAKSGDATVTGNTAAGDALSGNANTAVNILNMTGSNLSLSNWFGVLFINVFGNWNGSFGIDTSAGDQPAVAPASSSEAKTLINPSPAPKAPKLISFIPAGIKSNSQKVVNNLPLSNVATVLGFSTSSLPLAAIEVLPSDPPVKTNYWIPAIGVSIFLIMIAGERLIAIRRANKI